MNIIYYKCECGWRIGKPGKKPNTYSYFRNTMGLPNKTYEMFYCENCKKTTPHYYCGWRSVEK